MTTQLTGVTKNIRHDQGIGYLVSQDGQDYFWDVSDLQGIDILRLENDVEVSFEPQPASSTFGQPRANNVRLAKKPGAV